MGIFDQLGKAQQDPRQMQQTMQQEVKEISRNPSAYLKKYGFSIPEDMTDAKQITQYLLQTGQIGTQKLQQTIRMLER